MMRGNTFNFKNKAGYLIAGIIIIIVVIIKSLSSSQAFGLSAVLQPKNIQSDYYKIVFKEALPVLETENYDKPDIVLPQNIFNNILDHFASLDITNPKTYLKSEIPLLGMFDSSNIDEDSDGVSSSGTSGGTPSITPEVASRGNTGQDKPVVSTNVDSSKPLVIIYHTHATESFTSSPKYSYTTTQYYRTTDKNFNNCRVGEEIKNYLEQNYGIPVYHDTTLHDNPSYNLSYSKSRVTAENLVKKYPGAEFVIDLHRDAFPDSTSGRKATTTTINGQTASKVMFVIGKSDPHWQENYALATKLKQKLDELYPGLTRNTDLRDNAIFNQDISNSCILIEIGSNYNTMDEQLVTAKLVGRALGDVIKGNK